MSTPEGTIKREVKKILEQYKPELYALWPVQCGLGAPTLDCIGVHNHRAFAIETKAPGGKPTERQEITMNQMRVAGAMVFVIDGPKGYAHLKNWLEAGKSR